MDGRKSKRRTIMFALRGWAGRPLGSSDMVAAVTALVESHPDPF